MVRSVRWCVPPGPRGPLRIGAVRASRSAIRPLVPVGRSGPSRLVQFGGSVRPSRCGSCRVVRSVRFECRVARPVVGSGGRCRLRRLVQLEGSGHPGRYGPVAVSAIRVLRRRSVDSSGGPLRSTAAGATRQCDLPGPVRLVSGGSVGGSPVPSCGRVRLAVAGAVRVARPGRCGSGVAVGRSVVGPGGLMWSAAANAIRRSHLPGQWLVASGAVSGSGSFRRLAWLAVAGAVRAARPRRCSLSRRCGRSSVAPFTWAGADVRRCCGLQFSGEGGLRLR
ncbi:hypothetical protein SAMN05216270_11784 [Glycomyces harbinensis]|uniref:Uncharacterized protein n=1 Tax=Glycomyces harbinensis TaxID=58114 RepID=A0A1G7BPR0_9ACTN|nr:hypothetical protein SAMN05216270_11784 [Glycomyces harbinensis]